VTQKDLTMTKCSYISTLTAGLLLTASAYAGHSAQHPSMPDFSYSTQNSNNDMFIAAKVGWSKLNFDTTEKNHGIGGGVELGYMFSDYFGLDLGADFYPKVKNNTKSDFGYHFALKLQATLNDDLDLYLKAGPGITSTKYLNAGTVNTHTVVANKSYHKTAAYVAIGAAYHVESFDLFVEGSAYSKSKMNPARFGINAGIAVYF
jgi:hypothetical protein